MRRTASAQSIRRAHAVEEIGPAHSALLSSPSDKVGSPVSLALGKAGGGARSIFEGSRKQAGGAAPLDMRARLLKAQHLFSAEKKARPAARPDTAPAGSPSLAKEDTSLAKENSASLRASPRLAALATKIAAGSPAAAAAASPSSPQSSPVAPLADSPARKRT